MERLKKIQALALSGIEGEKLNAIRMLNELLRKYSITLEELTGLERFPVVFGFSNEQEEIILNHVVMKICRTQRVKNWTKGKKRTFMLTRLEEIDAKDAYVHYRKEFKTDLTDLTSAFIHRHHLFAPDEGDEKKEFTAEDIKKYERLVALMSGMQSREWGKRYLLTEKA